MADPGPYPLSVMTARITMLAAQEAAQTISGSQIAWSVILLVVLVFINAFFAASEIAVISVSETRLYALAEEGNKKAKIIQKLAGEPSKFLASIQIGITLAGLLSSAFTADRFAGPLAAQIGTWIPGADFVVLKNICVILLTILLSFFTLIFGELVPKRLAQQNPEKMSFAFAGILLFFYQIFRPFVFVLAKTTNGVLRLFGIDPHQEQEQVTEEEIRMMVDVGNEKGVIEKSQKDMINNIFEFDDRTAGEVMTHRTEVSFVSADAGIREVLDIAIQDGYSRIPAYGEDIDDVVGIIYVKDLLPLIMQENVDHVSLRKYLRPVLFVPESNHCKELFKEFTDKKVQMAIVVDEYGGTAGIVTMEDVLEAIVGNIQDEYDQEEEEIQAEDDNSLLLEGSADLDDVFERFGLEPPEDVECDTIGGYVIDLLDRIPADGETPEADDGSIHFQVLEVEDRRIMRMKATLVPKAEPEEEEDSRRDKKEKESSDEA